MQTIHIKLNEGQKLFFTSDLHLGHRNVLNFCNRPFTDVKDMERKLIENWNSVVGDDDIVFDLGDMFWFISKHETKRFINKLNGTIYKLPGNHDMDIKSGMFGLCFTNKVILCDDIVQLFVSGLKEEKPSAEYEIWLSHFPMLTWPHREKNNSGDPKIQLFGHIHSGELTENLIDVPGVDIVLKEKQQYDVGVDNNNFTPIEIREIYEKLK